MHAYAYGVLAIGGHICIRLAWDPVGILAIMLKEFE
jgi:hypothetical protein